MPPQITLPIRGAAFPNKKRGPTRRFAIELLRPGDAVELRLEPENPADENAVAIYSSDGLQMGYVPAERAPYIGMLIKRSGVTAVFQGQSDAGAFIRLAFGGEEPVLPEQKPREEAVDWWPDEDWPD